ncbi:MAG: aldo/keto reductase [Gemmatimonadales bacterium]
MEITHVGLGAWAIGGGTGRYGWGSQDDRDSIAAIHRAVELGINWIDTAAVYGLGHSERVVGAALRELPRNQRPLVFTKGGLVWDDNNPGAEPKRIASPASLRREVQASIERLGVERIDLYQLHWPPDDGTPMSEYWGELQAIKRDGLARAVGLSNHDVAHLARAEAIAHVESLQPPFSVIRRKVADAELVWCEEHRTGVIVYAPMQSGLLTGSFTAARAAALPANDWRSRSANFSGEPLRHNLALVDALRPIAARRGVSVGAIAIAWTLAWPGVTSAIVGARNLGQVDGWIAAATLALAPEDLSDISAAIVATGAGSGPDHPPRPSVTA